jgi:hypothetical protein
LSFEVEEFLPLYRVLQPDRNLVILNHPENR